MKFSGLITPHIYIRNLFSKKDGKIYEKFIHKLQCKFNKIKIARVDERLTTVEAHKTMNFLNVNKHKKRNIVDTISAVYILETYMNKRKNNV